VGEIKSPYLVDWAITPKCNLNCQHCRGFPEGEISTERASRLIAEIAELRPDWVIIEGGEPLLREDIFELLGLMRERELEVHLITNGMLITPQIIASLRQLGVKVMVSIDGATPATYEAVRNGASFERVVQSAREYAREGLAAEIGVKRVTFIGLKPCEGFQEKLLTPEEYGEAIELTCRAAQKTGVEFFFDEPFFWPIVKERGLVAGIPAEDTGILVSSTPACIFGEYIFIETDGDVKPCSFSPVAFGNVNEKALVQLWNEMLDSSLIKQIKDPGTRTGACLSCQYLRECKGCRSRTFALTGDWFASDSVCPLRAKT